jgi:hypothetical protein
LMIIPSLRRPISSPFLVNRVHAAAAITGGRCPAIPVYAQPLGSTIAGDENG